MKANTKALKDFDKKIQDLEKALEVALGGLLPEEVKEVLPEECIANISSNLKQITNEQSKTGK